MQVLQRAPWYADIMAEGEAKGRAEGRHAAQRAMLLLVCEARFKPLPRARRAWLDALPDDQVELATTIAATAASIDEVVARLQRT